MTPLTLRTDTHPPRVLYWGLQPATLAFAYAAAAGLIPGLNIYTGLLIVFAVLTLCEEVWPARREWRQSGRERLGVLTMFVLSSAAIVVWELAYPALLQTPLTGLRETLRPLWPDALPMPLQALLAFLVLQFVAYWLHRLSHQLGWLWRGSGHGVHHTYTKLNALNWNANHPLEAALLVAPAAVLALVFGIEEPALLAVALAFANVANAHLNMRVNHRVVSWLFTTNVHHLHHHSARLSESNTNFGCASVLWDRVFGTYSLSDTERLGDFRREPSFREKFSLPLANPPSDAFIEAGRG